MILSIILAFLVVVLITGIPFAVKKGISIGSKNTQLLLHDKSSKKFAEKTKEETTEDRIIRFIEEKVAAETPAPEGTMWLLTTHLPRVKTLKYSDEEMEEFTKAWQKSLAPQLKKRDEVAENFLALRKRLHDNGMEFSSANQTAKVATGYNLSDLDPQPVVKNYVTQDVDDVFATLSLVDNNMNPLDSFVHRISRFEKNRPKDQGTMTYEQAFKDPTWPNAVVHETISKLVSKFALAAVDMRRKYNSTHNPPELHTKVFK